MRLEIVVAADCPVCDEARAIAQEVRARFPKLEVDLIDVGGERPAPSQVIATPTYLLDGTVISLGNPRRETLMQALQRRLRGRGWGLLR